LPRERWCPASNANGPSADRAADGILLPRMSGAFGRRDWVANGLMHATCHLHMPWAIPALLVDMFLIAYPARRS